MGLSGILLLIAGAEFVFVSFQGHADRAFTTLCAAIVIACGAFNLVLGTVRYRSARARAS
jgi:uncharacterized membrane protein HdeD (DUF308 family)